MFKQTATKTVKLTADLALDFSTMRATPGERRLDQRRIDYLWGELRSGKFRSPTWARAKWNDTWHRVNGQHTSMMLASKIDTTDFPFGLEITIEEFECESVHDLCELFRTYDNKNSVRSHSDIVNQHLRSSESATGVPTSAAEKALAGIILWYVAYGQSMWANDVPSDDEKYRLIFSNQNFIEWSHKHIYHKHLAKPGVFAAALELYRMKIPNLQDVELFFEMVLKESHPDSKNATRTLATFLKDLKNKSSPAYKEFSGDTKAHLAKCIHAWNAWRKGAPTALSYYRDKRLPWAE